MVFALKYSLPLNQMFMYKIKFTFVLLALFSSLAALAQPEIISVGPTAALPGETFNVAVTGSNTNFQQGLTTLDFGMGVQVSEVQVNHSLYLTALVEVEVGALPGFRDLTITTGSETVGYSQALEILEPGGAVTVVLTIIPVQTLYLSDLNPDDPADNPLLFNVTLYNDNIERDLRVEYVLSNEEFGVLGTSEKTFTNLPPLSVESFDNREFDEYNLNPASPELVNVAASTGVLPAGPYTYSITVYDETGAVVAEDDGINIITNETTIIDLIGPGTPLDQNPETVLVSTPFFQWFSNLGSFDFALYEVNEGQQSAFEITANLPVYEESGLSTSFFQYPISAEILEPNQVYAWQVTGTQESTQGPITVYSEVFWFQVETSGGGSGIQITSLEINPEFLELPTGGEHQFTALGYGQNGEQIPVNCTWSVVPSTAGTVDGSGYFSAGNQPVVVAVVASYGGFEAYSTVTLTWSVTDQYFDIEMLFDQIFGLQKDN